MNKIAEIFNAWRIAMNPDDSQYELAVKRIEICNECEFKSEIPIGPIFRIARCSVCGCALKGKIYTEKTFLDEGGSCPKEKWADVEKVWLETRNPDIQISGTIEHISDESNQ